MLLPWRWGWIFAKLSILFFLFSLAVFKISFCFSVQKFLYFVVWYQFPFIYYARNSLGFQNLMVGDSSNYEIFNFCLTWFSIFSPFGYPIRWISELLSFSSMSPKIYFLFFFFFMLVCSFMGNFLNTIFPFTNFLFGSSNLLFKNICWISTLISILSFLNFSFFLFFKHTGQFL